MKKYILLIFGIVLLLACNESGAQTVNKYITKPTNTYFWGATTDTLVASDTIAYVVRLQDQTVQDLNFGLYVTKVSGTVTTNFVLYASMDGTNWESTGDSIKLSNASTGMQTYVDVDDFNYPYYKWQSISGATTQKAWYKMYVINRKE